VRRREDRPQDERRGTGAAIRDTSTTEVTLQATSQIGSATFDSKGRVEGTATVISGKEKGASTPAPGSKASMTAAEVAKWDQPLPSRTPVTGAGRIDTNARDSNRRDFIR
jgi:hypothetical protein